MDPSQLHKLDLNFSGNWIAGSDRDEAAEAQRLLKLVETEFACAVVCCLRFEPITHESVRLRMNQSAYDRSLNYVYARQFVYSLDSISKILRVLASLGSVPEAASKSISEYGSLFGDLKQIRDSALHIEDRGRGLRKHGKRVPSVVIILGGFTGSRFDFTGEDGICYGVDISESTLAEAHNILQSIIDAFAWE
jgi:hypothetical protein